jgi:CRP-like cAMP-binding protein
MGLAIKIENRILGLLPPDEIERLRPRLKPVVLESRQVLYEPGQPIRHVYFPNSGVVSWLAVMENGASVEVATIGNEGVVGFRAILGSDTAPAKVMVQVSGEALRTSAKDLKAKADGSGPLIPILHRYLNAFVTQITQSVGCNTFHSVEQRFCRWLLMTHDRVRSEQLPLTHELLGQMLGVRRASVTEAARRLQNAGLIRYIHGKITILDRAGLESASCDCYRIVKSDFDRLLGKMK